MAGPAWPADKNRIRTIASTCGIANNSPCDCPAAFPASGPASFRGLWTVLMFVPTCRHCLFLSLVLNTLAMAAAASDAAGQSSPPSDWTVVQVPDVWRKVPTGRLAPIDGYSWYRTAVRVPDAWSGHDLILAVEALDDVRSA